MRRRIRNEDDNLDSILCPIYLKSFSKRRSLRLGPIAPSRSDKARKVFLHYFDVVGEPEGSSDITSVLWGVIAESDEANPDLIL